MISAVTALGAFSIPSPASAAAETFHRFEAIATANYTVTQDCPDGSSVQQQVRVIGGHEEESESSVSTLDSDFVTVFIRGFDCDGNFSSDSGSGPADVTFSPSLRPFSVAGTISTRGGRIVAVDMMWSGTRAVEATSNTTIFPGFTGHFTGKRRDATATGTVVIDNETVVNGSTTNAEIETLEDKNTSHG